MGSGAASDHVFVPGDQGAGINVPNSLAMPIEQLEGGGIPLGRDDREFFEPRFQQDFSRVRIHSDRSAAQLARSLEAYAFTYGRNIVFAAGAYSPHSAVGRQLLAHELTHVIQQQEVPESRLVQRSSWYDSVKQKAYSKLISGLRGAKQAAMNALRARVSKLPGAFQSAAYTLINIFETVIEVIFSIWFAVIGILVGFSEGIVDLVKGIILLGYGVTKLQLDLYLAIFGDAESLKTDLNLVVAAITGLPAALSKLVTDWTTRFEKAPTEMQSIMIGELTGQVLALIATWGAGAARAGTGAKVAAGGAEVVEAAAEVTATGVKATGAAAEATSSAAKTTSAVTRPTLTLVERGGQPAAASMSKTAAEVAAAPRPIPAAYSQGGNALKFAPEAEEAAVAAAKQPTLKLVPRPVEVLPATPVLSEPLVPVVEATAKGTGTGIGTKVAVGAAVATARAAAKKAKKKPKECNNSPCDDPLPIIWPREQLPPIEGSSRSLKRTSSDQREAEGIDRGKDQRKYSECLTDARKRGEDLQTACGHLGGDWFDPELLPSEPADAHHMHPLYLGGEEARENLGAIFFKRHQLGHKLLNDQTLMFEADPTWIHCRVCSPLLTRHPIDQEYEIRDDFF